MINQVIDSLSNREIALLWWIGILILIGLFTKVFRDFLIDATKILFSKNLLFVFFLLIVYVLAIIITLWKINFWSIEHLKDTLFWFFTVGIVLVFQINNIKEVGYFKTLVFSAFKWTILLEFVTNVYSFSLLTEFILLPGVVFFALLQVVAGMDEKHKKVLGCLNVLLVIYGLSIFGYSMYKTILHFSEFNVANNLLSLLLPSVITMLFVPYLYLLAVYSTYESFFIRLNFMAQGQIDHKKVKRQIRKVAGFNLDKIVKISKKINSSIFYSDTDFNEYLKEIVK